MFEESKDGSAGGASKKERLSGPLIMIDHGGVLDEKASGEEGPHDGDFVLSGNEFYSAVMPNGAQAIQLLNRLVKEYKVRLVCHSKNKEKDQTDILRGVSAAIKKYNKESKGHLDQPVFSAMVVADSKKYADKHPDGVLKIDESEDGIAVLGYDAKAEDSGKSLVRKALSMFYGIKEVNRSSHYVLDDGFTNHEAAKEEGYTSYLIGQEGYTFVGALSEILKDLAKKNDESLSGDDLDSLVNQKSDDCLDNPGNQKADHFSPEARIVISFLFSLLVIPAIIGLIQAGSTRTKGQSLLSGNYLFCKGRKDLERVAPEESPKEEPGV
jgi:hypothetical protein